MPPRPAPTPPDPRSFFNEQIFSGRQAVLKQAEDPKDWTNPVIRAAQVASYMGPPEDEPRPTYPGTVSLSGYDKPQHPYAQAVGQAHKVASQMQEDYHTQVIAQAKRKRGQ